MEKDKAIFTLNFVGDVMIGRLIDQLSNDHVDEPEDAEHASAIKWNRPHLSIYGRETPWGDTLSIFQNSDLNLANLETSLTTHPIKWPNKVFNYRSHPANVAILQAAKIDYVSLANNHTLDFSEAGLQETVRTVRRAGIAFAGAGENSEQAQQPALLSLPRTKAKGEHSYSVHVYAGSDHPTEWRSIPSFHLIDYSQTTRHRLKTALTNSKVPPDLKIFSVHWGPNYSWKPAEEIRSLAHFLVDECGVNIVHGHSSHHVQGIEHYHRALIIYGCGDFVEDYAVTPGFRNDLSAIWRVSVTQSDSVYSSRKSTNLVPVKLEVIPTRIQDFQVTLLDASDPDYEFVCTKVINLSAENGSEMASSSAAVSHRRNPLFNLVQEQLVAG